MIELQTLEDKARQALLHNLEKPTIIKFSKAKYKQPTVKLLTKEFGKKYEKEIWVIVTNAATCQRYDTKGFRIPLGSTPYELSNAVTKQSIDNKRMNNLLHLMDNAGYITLLKGYGNSKTDHARSGVIVKPKLDDMIDRSKSKTQALKREDQLNIIEVVDIENTIVSKKRVNGKMKTSKSIVLLKTEGRTFTGLAEKRVNLMNFNLQVEKSVISVKGNIDNRIVFKQRFEGDLNGCGRYWCGRLQQVGTDSSKEATREDILIGGEGVCEADYKTIQPRLLYIEEGVTVAPEFDVYGANLSIEGLNKKETRNFIKGCMFSILFSAKRGAAKTSITEKIKEEGLVGKITSEEVLVAMEEHNAPIAHRFFNKTYYRQLQNAEAGMAEYVINHFTAKGITVLPWHDSFVINMKHGEELIDIMHKAWEHVTGNTDMCVVDKEFGFDKVVEITVEEVITLEDVQELPPVDAYESLFEREEYNVDTFGLSVGQDLPTIDTESFNTSIDSTYDDEFWASYLRGETEVPSF